MDRLSMSLDDLMASRAKEAKNKKPVNSGGVRNQKKQSNVRSAPYEDRPRRNPEPVVRVQERHAAQSNAPPKQQHLSVFARLGKPPVSGTRVTFANLKDSVEESDLQDLCAAIGEVKDVELTAGRNGRNSAVVLFSRRSDALTCVEKLNGMTLDGSPMEVSVTGEPVVSVAPKSVFDRLQGAPAGQNVRQGLFGTAMDANDDDTDGNGPKFSVTLSGTQPVGRQTKLVQPFSDDRTSSKGLVQPFAKADNSNQQSSNGGNGSNGGSRFLYRGEDDRGNGNGNERRDRGDQVRQPFAGQQRNQSRGNSGGGPVRGRGGSSNHSGHDNRGGGGGRGNNRSSGGEKTKPLDASGLDADLDAYFASRA